MLKDYRYASYHLSSFGQLHNVDCMQIPDTAFWDSIPPAEAYFHDPEYVN